MVDRRLWGQRPLQRGWGEKQQRQSGRGNWEVFRRTAPAADTALAEQDTESMCKLINIIYLFINLINYFTKSKVFTFNVLKVPEQFCPSTKKKADAETLAPVLKRCSERSVMRNIKASQSPPPPWTHSIIMHIEPDTSTENATSVTLRASFSHPFSALLLKKWAIRCYNVSLLDYLLSTTWTGKNSHFVRPQLLHVSFCELNVLEFCHSRPIFLRAGAKPPMKRLYSKALRT